MHIILKGELVTQVELISENPCQIQSLSPITKSLNKEMYLATIWAGDVRAARVVDVRIISDNFCHPFVYELSLESQTTIDPSSISVYIKEGGDHIYWKGKDH